MIISCLMPVDVCHVCMSNKKWFFSEKIYQEKKMSSIDKLLVMSSRVDARA